MLVRFGVSIMNPVVKAPVVLHLPQSPMVDSLRLCVTITFYRVKGLPTSLGTTFGTHLRSSRLLTWDSDCGEMRRPIGVHRHRLFRLPQWKPSQVFGIAPHHPHGSHNVFPRYDHLADICSAVFGLPGGTMFRYPCPHFCDR